MLDTVAVAEGVLEVGDLLEVVDQVATHEHGHDQPICRRHPCRRQCAGRWPGRRRAPPQCHDGEQGSSLEPEPRCGALMLARWGAGVEQDLERLLPCGAGCPRSAHCHGVGESLENHGVVRMRRTGALEPHERALATVAAWPPP